MKDQGADDNTIRLVEVQCSDKVPETADAYSKEAADQDAKEEQSASGHTDTYQSIQESVNGSPVLISSSQQSHTLNHHSKDPAVATATV